MTSRLLRLAAALPLAVLVLLPGTGLAQTASPAPAAPAVGPAATPSPAPVPPVAGPAAAPAPTIALPIPTINFRERPRYPTDPDRLRRRPTIDGVIQPDEWGAFYTITDAPVNGTVYLNWDDDNLYVAFKTDAPAWVVFDLDANGDGWLRGADNLELTIPPVTDGGKTPLSARILDASSGRDTPVWNDKVVDPKSIQMAEKSDGSGQVVEMAIPKGIAGLYPRSNAMMSCRADFLPAAVGQPAPTAPYEPHLLLDFTLVDSRSTGVVGIAPRLVLDDYKVIPGQTLRATFEIANQTDTERQIQSMSWHGDGPAADLINSLRQVSVPPVKGLKTTKLGYSSVIPQTAIPGYYQLTAKADLDQGRAISSTVSFSVVEPIQTHIEFDPQSVTILGPTQLKVVVVVDSAIPGYANGLTELTLPAGWEVKGGANRRWSVDREDREIRQVFAVTLPSATQAGDYEAYATVNWRGKLWKTHQTIHVDRAPSADAGTAPAAAPAK